MTAVVALFRGINVGGNHKVRMDELKALHVTLGLRDVVSYIQSGNVVFTSEDEEAAHLRKRIEEEFEKTFGFRSEALLRTSAELNEIIARSPFEGQSDKEPKWIAVTFLADHPESTAQEALLNSYAGPEEIHFHGKEMYIYYTEGMGRSKLTNNFIEKKLKTVGTTRNWNTILQLQAMMQR
jgi:uncharacterized protein (DUF1697 family)